MLYVIGKVRNKADGPVARGEPLGDQRGEAEKGKALVNPNGKRLCGRADLSLVTRVE
jgi:hypothetical protein